MTNKAQRRLARQQRRAESRALRNGHETLQQLREDVSTTKNPASILPGDANGEVEIHGLLFSLRVDTAAGRFTDTTVKRKIINDTSYTFEQVKKAIWEGVEQWPHRGGIER